MSSAPKLSVQPITTRIFQDQENLLDFVVSQIPADLVREEMVLAVTSKIVSLAEGRLLDKTSIDKEALINQEADSNFGEIGYGCFLTIKHGLFIASAGIDESNSQSEKYILYPKDPFLSAKNLWSGLKKKWNLEKLGILMTDSHTSPLRRGVTGIALAHWGFSGLRNLIGTPDLFGRHLQMTTMNLADGLAAAATLMMGEANESRPLAVIACEGLNFADEINPAEVKIPMKEDLYYPIFEQLLKQSDSQAGSKNT